VTLARGALAGQILALGVEKGGVLTVHTAFSKVGPVEDGPRGLIESLQQALGPDGTLVMPSMSDDDDQLFDATATPCRGMGVVADLFWKMPGVMRSDSPHAFAARGPRALEITAPHPLDVPHGPDSPVGRAAALDGQVLLLGVGHDANTSVHLAENLAGVGYRVPKRLTVLRDGRPVRYAYAEVDHCCQGFARMDAWLEAEGRQRRGMVGRAESRLVRSRDVVDTALAHLRRDETVFLHPSRACAECDEARANMPRARP
jgi:aminoglycoside N3'-acetyltransferase